MLLSPSTSRHYRARINGFSLIELVVSIAVLGIVTLAVMTMLTNVTSENKFLSQKIDALDFAESLRSEMLNSGNCPCQFSTVVIDASSATIPDVSLPQLTASCTAGAPVIATPSAPLPGSANGLHVASIRFSGIAPTGNPNEFTGTFEVAFDQTVRAMQPIKIRQRLSVDPAAPVNAKPVAACQSSAMTNCHVVDNYGAPLSYVSVASCAPNETIMGGGGECDVPGHAPPMPVVLKHGFLHSTGRNGNSWVADCYRGDLGSDIASHAWAYCCS